MNTVPEIAGEIPLGRQELGPADDPQTRVPVPPTGDVLARLGTTLNSMLARLEAAPETVRNPVDLAELVRRQLARRVDEGVELTFDAAESVVVAGDAGKLDRLVRNLVDNAMRHARSAVTVRIGQHAGKVVLQVDDDGAGIPEQDRERVFERFTRLDEARSRDAGGVGLGLAIAREIAQRHGGTLRAGESPGGGARFTVVLREA